MFTDPQEEQLGKLKVQARAPTCGQDLCNKLQVGAASTVSNTRCHAAAAGFNSLNNAIFFKRLNRIDVNNLTQQEALLQQQQSSFMQQPCVQQEQLADGDVSAL